MIFNHITANAETESEYQIWVGEVQVTESNKNDILGTADKGATVVYNPDTNLLILNNANIKEGKKVDKDNHQTFRVAIYSTIDLNISLKGNNILGETDETKYTVENNYNTYGYSINYGIWTENSNLKFIESNNSGTLNIIDYSDGIKANNITFDTNFGKLEIFDLGKIPAEELPPCAISASGNIIINGGEFNLQSELQNGITANKVIINNGFIKIKSSPDKNAILTCEGITIDDDLMVVNSQYIKETTNTLLVTDVDTDDGFVTIKKSNYNYEFIDGNNQKYTSANFKKYSIIINGDYALFESLKIGNLDLIKDEDYMVTEGSTVITFTDKGINKLNTLSKGNYEIIVKYSNTKEVKGNLIITDDIGNPKTGDNFVLYLIIGSISLISLAGCVFYLKRKKI